ncbi:MAG: metallophosphoesterase family protein [Candidatus Aquicultorales bacterium]
MTRSNTNPITVVHFADLHLGVENYGKSDPASGLNRRVLDFLGSLRFLVEYAIENGAALVVFSGDAYKNQKPSPTLQREFARQVKRLANAGIEVFLLVGNHDLPQAEKQAHALSIFSALEVERVTVGREMAVYQLETREGPVDILAIPSISRGQLLARERYVDLSPSEIEDVIAGEIERRLVEMAGGLRSGVPAIVAAHASVSTATYGSERSVLLGQELSIAPSSLAMPGIDYVALGHIHKHQDLTVGAYPPIVYSGSLERVDFGEEKEAKGFCLVSLARARTTYEFIEAPARRFLTIEADCGEIDPTRDVLRAVEGADLEGAVVRARVRVPVAAKESLRRDEIRAALDGAYFVGPIEIENVGEERRGRNPHLTEGKGPIEALEQYILTREELQDRKDALLETAKAMVEEMEREKVTEAL